MPNAEEVKSFYKEVVGWKSETVNMGEYNDFNMQSPASGETKTGICHKKGGNVDFPSQWLIYITVKNVDESAKLCKGNDGKVLVGPKEMKGYRRYCVIEDPAGAVCALFESA